MRGEEGRTSAGESEARLPELQKAGTHSYRAGKNTGRCLDGNIWFSSRVEQRGVSETRALGWWVGIMNQPFLGLAQLGKEARGGQNGG